MNHRQHNDLSQTIKQLHRELDEFFSSPVQPSDDDEAKRALSCSPGPIEYLSSISVDHNAPMVHASPTWNTTGDDIIGKLAKVIELDKSETENRQQKWTNRWTNAIRILSAVILVVLVVLVIISKWNDTNWFGVVGAGLGVQVLNLILNNLHPPSIK